MTVRNNTITGVAQSAAVNHPTGLTALATSALVIVASKLGLELTAVEAGVFIGLLTAIASALSPRYRSIVADQIADNDPPAGGTGPDPTD